MKALARHTFWVFGLTMMVASMVLVGCGSNDGGGAPPAVVGPAGPIGVAACPAGQVMTAHNCLYTASCQNTYPGYGWLPGENRCVPPLPGSPGAVTSGNFVGSLTIQSPQTFALMLQNYGLCSPYVIGINLGNANCDNYTHAGYMSLQAAGSTGGVIPAQAIVVIGAGASFPTQANNKWITGGAVLRPSFSSPLAPATTNGTAGFTGTGPYGFRFVVTQGLPGNSYQMPVNLMYNGAVFATGNLIAQ